MRPSGILLAGLLLAGVVAGEEDPCLEAVGVLAQRTLDGSASWDKKYEAYKEVKATLKALADAAEEEKKEAAKALENRPDLKQAALHEKCQAAYEAIRADVADSLRRDAVPASGWLLGLFGACLMWGGFALCSVIAFRSGESGTEED